MDIEKCRTCKHFDSFFHSCNLFYIESYLDEGDFDILTVDIKNVHETECKYEKIQERTVQN